MLRKTGAFILCVVLATYLFCGCTMPNNAENGVNDWRDESTDQDETAEILAAILDGSSSSGNPPIAKIDIFSAIDNQLIKTIEDRKVLDSFAENASEIENVFMDGEDPKLSDYTGDYIFAVYRVSAAVGSNDYVKLYDITTYKDTNILKMQISPEIIKNIKLPASLLTYSYEGADDVIQYLYSLLD